MTQIPTGLRDRLAAEIAAAGGREVCFVAELDASGNVTRARPVARGTPNEVLALPGVATRGEMLLHNHPGGDLEPSAADLNVAASLYEAGVGFGIIDNDATSLYVVAEVPRAKSYQRVDAIETANLLGTGGPVAQGLGQFEDRPSQRDMASFVADVYNDGGVSLLEAGTGVGKSFAYLVPAFSWARANEPTRSTCKSSWWVGTCRSSAACLAKRITLRLTPYSKVGPTTSACHGWTWHLVGRHRCSIPSGCRSWRDSQSGPRIRPMVRWRT